MREVWRGDVPPNLPPLGARCGCFVIASHKMATERYDACYCFFASGNNTFGLRTRAASSIATPDARPVDAGPPSSDTSDAHSPSGDTRTDNRGDRRCLGGPHIAAQGGRYLGAQYRV